MNKKLLWLLVVAVIVFIIILMQQGSSPALPPDETQQPVTQTPTTTAPTPTKPTTTTATKINNALVVKNQKPNSSTIIASATLEKAGFVVIRSVAHDGPKEIQGAVLGASPLLSRGTHTNVKANVALSPAGIYYANLYSDNGNKVFSTAEDLQLKDVNGNPFQVRFEANVPATANQSYTIGMKNGAFSPAALTVSQGSIVFFTNNDVGVHAVIFPTLGGEHVLAVGASYVLYTSSLAPGAYKFRDNYNTSMTGTLTIE